MLLTSLHLIYVKTSPEITYDNGLPTQILFLSQQLCGARANPLWDHVHCLQPCVNKQSMLHSRQSLIFCTLFISQPGKSNPYFGRQDDFNELSDFVGQLVSPETRFDESFIGHLLCFNQQVNGDTVESAWAHVQYLQLVV